MTVSTNQLLVRKDFTFIRSSLKQPNKTVALLLKLQIQSIIRSYLFYPKKRFFFLQSARNFNCFNPLMAALKLQGVFNSKRYFFSNKASGRLYWLRCKNKFSSNSELLLNIVRPKRSAMLVSQLFWNIFVFHRTFSTPVYGLLNRYTRFSKYLRFFYSMKWSNRFYLRQLYTSSHIRTIIISFYKELVLEAQFERSVVKFPIQYKSFIDLLNFKQWFLFIRLGILLQKDVVTSGANMLLTSKSPLVNISKAVLDGLSSLLFNLFFFNFKFNVYRRRMYAFAGSCLAKHLVFSVNALVDIVNGNDVTIVIFNINFIMIFTSLFTSCLGFFFYTLSTSLFFLRYFFLDFVYKLYIPLISVDQTFNNNISRLSNVMVENRFTLVRLWLKRWILKWRRHLLSVVIERLRFFRFYFKKIIRNKLLIKKNYMYTNRNSKTLYISFRSTELNRMKTTQQLFPIKHWLDLKSLRFSKYRLLQLIKFYSGFNSHLNQFKFLRQRSRRRSMISWGVYVNGLNKYWDTSSTSMPYTLRFFGFKSKLYSKSFKNSMQAYVRFSMLWGKRFCRALVRYRKVLIKRSKHSSSCFVPSVENAWFRTQSWFFLLPFMKYRKLGISHYYNEGLAPQYCTSYKFYTYFIRNISVNFRQKHARFWLISKFARLRKIKRFIRSELRVRLFGYGYNKQFSEYFHSTARRTLVTYSMFRKKFNNINFNYFFSQGLDVLNLYFIRKFRRIKRRLQFVNCSINFWNKIILVNLSFVKLKRKPFAVVKMKRLEPEMQIMVHIQKHKLYSQLYRILIKFVFAFRLTTLWLRMRGIVVFFSPNQTYVLDRNRLRRFLYTVRNSFYLRYYKNKKNFLNALLYTVVSMYYRSPFILNESLCYNLEHMWKHRVHIFDTFKLITAVLWRTAYKNMSSDLNIKTVYMQINGKINSGTRTKSFKLKVDYKPAMMTLQNSLSFSCNTANARTGTFGIQTWFCY